MLIRIIGSVPQHISGLQEFRLCASKPISTAPPAHPEPHLCSSSCRLCAPKADQHCPPPPQKNSPLHMRLQALCPEADQHCPPTPPTSPLHMRLQALCPEANELALGPWHMCGLGLGRLSVSQLELLQQLHLRALDR